MSKVLLSDVFSCYATLFSRSVTFSYECEIIKCNLSSAFAGQSTQFLICSPIRDLF
jgi:hypothetical protein